MKVRVLVLEDQVTAQMVRTVLERAGAEVECATTCPCRCPPALTEVQVKDALRTKVFIRDRNDWRQDRRRRGRKA